MKTNARVLWVLLILLLVVGSFLLLRSYLSTDQTAEAPPTDAATELVVGSWGGAYQEAQRKAFFEPFTAETGIKIRETSTPDYGKFYEWQRAGAASIDVIDVETYFVYQAARKGALYRIPDEIIAEFNLMPGAIHEYGVATAAYADVIAWNSDRHPEWTSLTWSDFWNVDAYPGARGLRDLPASTFEAALLAAGKEPKAIYPIDVPEAFASLTRIRNEARVAVWGSGSQPIEWLLTGAVEMTTAWNGRVYDAQHEGKPVSMTFKNGMLDWLWWVVPRDAPNKELAMKFIAFTLRPDRQAELTRHIPYGPSNSDATSMIEPETLKILPTGPDNLAHLIRRDNEWWAQNDEAIQPQWRAWKLGLSTQ